MVKIEDFGSTAINKCLPGFELCYFQCFIFYSTFTECHVIESSENIYMIRRCACNLIIHFIKPPQITSPII
ncbi:hypothetical protein L6452_28741 [Arctium lappa]|uniref:Uncharacterized protein n=1 Tax=Arctium lappa TaxID=4217 RepID=A0ACB8ZZI1_ARCLA|nr:hypothetical protein L6452_28741 [Arctium lappa]